MRTPPPSDTPEQDRMRPTIERLKQECSLVADGLLTPKASFTPMAAKALLVAIEALEGMVCDQFKEHLCDNDGSGCPACRNAEVAIEAIREQFAGG